MPSGVERGCAFCPLPEGEHEPWCPELGDYGPSYRLRDDFGVDGFGPWGPRDNTYD